MDIVVPASVRKHGDDRVSFTITYLEPSLKKGPITSEHKSDVCYATCMRKLQRYEYHLYPHARDSILPRDEYHQWISLCKKNQLMPTEAVPDVENGKNKLYIPNNNYNRHIIYAALCCYRWAENNAPLPYTVVKVVEKHKVHFFQALHYAMALHATWQHGDHSFAPMSILDAGQTYYNTVGYGKSGGHYLPWSIATWFFFRGEPGKTVADEIGDNCPQQYGYGDTMGTIHKVMRGRMACEEPQKGAASGSNKRPPLCLRDPGDILRPEFAKLYEVEKPVKDSLEGLFATLIS